MNEIVVFCGTTISNAEAGKILPKAHLAGPIKRGDILSYNAMIYCIIDGFFMQSLAVSPAEIVNRIREGKIVYGASSMGALRAAECYSIGMIGVGKTFKMYQQGILSDDDEVAVAVHPTAHQQLSDALVDIRAILMPDNEEHDLVLQKMKSTHFMERNFQECLNEMVQKDAIKQTTARLLSEKYKTTPRQKYLDAVECLETIRKLHA